MRGNRDVDIGIDVMQVCRNGHEVTASLRAHPEYGQKFCAECGAPTIEACPGCSKAIRGFNWAGSSLYAPLVPSYCEQCGAPFPWTASRFQAIAELISDLDKLSPDEQAALKGAVGDIATDSPRTDLGLHRFRKLASKSGQAVGGVLYKMAIDIATEAAKKGLLGS